MIEYYRIKKDKVEWKGERYFKLDYSSDLVVQVCLSPGPCNKQGKNAMFGIYTIARLTFLSNYFACGYVEKSQKKQFEDKADIVVKFLK